MCMCVLEGRVGDSKCTQWVTEDIYNFSDSKCKKKPYATKTSLSYKWQYLHLVVKITLLSLLSDEKKLQICLRT